MENATKNLQYETQSRTEEGLMPSNTKSLLALALLLSSSYLLFSTCGQDQRGTSVGQDVGPAQEVSPTLPEDGASGPQAPADPESPAEPTLVSSEATPSTSIDESRPERQVGETAAQTRVSPETSPTEPRPIPVTVPAGETLDIEFRQTLSSHTSQAGQHFRTKVVGPVSIGGRVVIPAGSSIEGVITEAEPAKKIGGRARLSLEFQTLTLVNGASYGIEAVFSQAGKSQTGKDAAIIGGATLGGAVLGKQVGGDTGTVIGAVAGGIGGALAAKKTKGKPVEIPAGTVMIVELTKPITIDVLP
jgi:hypothetical protein